jgi:hypothetical protein
MGVIYKLTHTESGKSYIGQTKGSLKTRLNGHKTKKGCTYIHNAVQKYGMKAFSVVELAITDDSELLNQLEIAAIGVNNTLYPNGYNLRNGGECSYHHEESKKKISEKAKAQFSSLEARTQASLKRGGKPFIIKDIHTGEMLYTGVNITGVCREFGLIRASLQKVLNKKSLSTHGVTAKYIDDDSVWPTADLLEQFQLDLRRCKGLKLVCPTWTEWLNDRG